MPRRVLFVESRNRTPHLETSLELVEQYLRQGDHVDFYFLGHQLPFREGVSRFPPYSPLDKLPEKVGIESLAHPNLRYRTIGAPLPTPRLNRTFDELTQLQQFTYRDAPLGLGVASSLVTKLFDSQPDLHEHRELVNDMLNSAAAVFDFTRRMIARRKIDRVVVFNGRFCNTRPVAEAARQAGVELLFHERGSSRNHYWVGDYMPHDRLRRQVEIKELWERVGHEPKSIELAKRFYEDRRGGLEQAWHSYTTDQEAGRLPAGLGPREQTISYFSSSDDEYVSVGDYYRWEGWRNQLEAVEQLCAAMPSDKRLVIRIHPHLTKKAPAELERWLAFEQRENVIVVRPDSPVDTYALIEASALVTTCLSTVGIEAPYWGVPSIALGPSGYSEMGVCETVSDAGRLREVLTSPPPVPSNRSGILAFGYYCQTFGIPFRTFEPSALAVGTWKGVNLQRNCPRHKEPIEPIGWRTKLGWWAQRFLPLGV
ncbi:MAG: hypothetical protein KDA83_21630 [Planctomycetales bacterium]|nr:hypothetical protein [Planctomycetales bacterium]